MLLLFLLNVFNPVVSSAENVQAALQAGKIYSTAAQKDPRVRAAFVKTKVLAPLAEAAKDDPDDARARILQAQWNLVLWKLRAGDILQALACAHQAEKLDPHGAGGWGVEYQVRMEFARQLEAVAHQADAGAALGPAYRIFLEEARPPVGPAERERIDEAKKKYRAAVKANKNNEINLFVAAVQYQEAAAVLERYLPNAPNNAALRYQLAETLYKAREDDRCRKVAEETLQLDAAASHPLLTDEQRRKLHFWQDLPATSALTASTFRRSGQANVGDIAPPGAMPENARNPAWILYSRLQCQGRGDSGRDQSGSPRSSGTDGWNQFCSAWGRSPCGSEREIRRRWFRRQRCERERVACRNQRRSCAGDVF